MTFFLIAGIVCVIVGVALVIVYLIAHKFNDKSTAAAAIMWIGTLFGLAGGILLTIEYSFPHISHPERYEERDFIDYVNVCVVAEFAAENGDDAEIITIYTMHVSSYYISDVHYRIVFDDNIYKVEYISSVNDNGELIMKKVEAN